MKINTLYFGLIAELKGVTSEFKDYGESLSINQLKADLNTAFPTLAEVNYSVAVNQKMVSEDITLSEGDEVSFFPPFAGG
jgi:molybdopterin converting factor small subunit